jgi:hypothetical protein
MSPSTTREQIIRSIQLPEHFTSRELLIVVAATVDQTDLNSPLRYGNSWKRRTAQP